MTIASEITRLQWAKASARTSIINKGVSVPANASVEDYHTYIDQIQQGASDVLIGGLKLFSVTVSSKGNIPDIRSTISWEEGGKYYGCCMCTIVGSTGNSLGNYIYTYRKLTNATDMDYVLNNISWDVSSNLFDSPQNISFWTNGTNMKIVFFLRSTYSTNPRFAYSTEWDYKTTWNTSNSRYERGSTSNISDYNIDLTWYTQVLWDERVGSVTGGLYSNKASIYLTLKA